MPIDRLPAPLRLAAYVAAVAALTWLCLAPSETLPSVSLWDKAEHALSWAVLTGAGLVLFPRQAAWIAAFAVVFGGAIEALQGLPAIHRDSDLADWIADLVGVGGAWLALRLARSRRR